jgi:hypothetical protein
LEFLLAVKRMEGSDEVAVFVEDAERDPAGGGNGEDELALGRRGKGIGEREEKEKKRKEPHR